MGRPDRTSRFWLIRLSLDSRCGSPVLFTSSWGGTDIALWAAVPWVLMFLTRAPDEAGTARWSSVTRSQDYSSASGVLARYASLFLVPYAVLVILSPSPSFEEQIGRRNGSRHLDQVCCPVWQSRRLCHSFNVQWRCSRWRFTGWRRGSALLAPVRGRLCPMFAAANAGCVFLASRYGAILDLRRVSRGGASVLAAGVLIGLPLLLMMTERRPFAAWCYDLRVVAAGLLIVLPVFLWTCGLLGAHLYVCGSPGR